MDGFPKNDEPHAAMAPYVVVFYNNGERLGARIRDVASQEQWILSDARSLRALLMRSKP